MRWRYPDRPIRIYDLSMVREGEWMSQDKWDGHFTVIIKDGSTFFARSRRNNQNTPMSESIIDELNSMSINDGTVLWGEWTSRRQSNKSESIRLFTIVYSGHKWLGNVSEKDRFDMLNEVIQPTERITIVSNRFNGYADHYRDTIEDWNLEGIVLKKTSAKLIGDIRSSKDNPSYLKLKWRDGHDGRSLSIIPDKDLATKE